MEMQTPPPPPKNSQNPAPPNPQALAVFQQGIEKAKQQGIQPETFVQLGQFARQALKDPALYPIFKNALIEKKLADPQDLPQGLDKKLLGTCVVLSIVAQKMIGGQ